MSYAFSKLMNWFILTARSNNWLSKEEETIEENCESNTDRASEGYGGFSHSPAVLNWIVVEWTKLNWAELNRTGLDWSVVTELKRTNIWAKLDWTE